MSASQEVTADELAKIRSLTDPELIVLVSEIHEHGWGIARRALAPTPATATPSKPTSPSGRVYFADGDDGVCIKVGFSTDPHGRVSRFVRGQRSGTPGVSSLRLIGSVPGTKADEARIHAWLAQWLIKGQREFFWHTPEVLVLVQSIIALGGVPEAPPGGKV